MTFEIKMTKDEIVEGLRGTYGKEFTAADVRGFCRMNVLKIFRNKQLEMRSNGYK